MKKSKVSASGDYNGFLQLFLGLKKHNSVMSDLVKEVREEDMRRLVSHLKTLGVHHKTSMRDLLRMWAVIFVEDVGKPLEVSDRHGATLKVGDLCSVRCDLMRDPRVKEKQVLTGMVSYNMENAVFVSVVKNGKGNLFVVKNEYLEKYA